MIIHSICSCNFAAIASQLQCVISSAEQRTWFVSCGLTLIWNNFMKMRILLLLKWAHERKRVTGGRRCWSSHFPQGINRSNPLIIIFVRYCSTIRLETLFSVFISFFFGLLVEQKTPHFITSYETTRRRQQHRKREISNFLALFGHIVWIGLQSQRFGASRLLHVPKTFRALHADECDQIVKVYYTLLLSR